LLVALALGACSSGGGDEGGMANRAPTANAGTSLTVVELTVVQLNGSGSDPDGDALIYAWSQSAGPAVVINNANMAQASFTAPDVAAGAPQLLTFRLTVTDTAGLSGNSNVNITAQEPAAAVIISGVVNYEVPPPVSSPVCDGLNFAAVQTRPIRRATVQILQSPANTVLGSMQSTDTGAYSFTIPGQTDVRLRVRAELKQGGAQSWDVEVRDNTQSTTLPLTQRPLYVMDSAVFNSGGVDSTRNLTATTGWGGNSYTGPRAAAPFAYSTPFTAPKLRRGRGPAATFPPLDVYWSVNNNTSAGTVDFFADIDTGDIGTSFYLGGSFSGLFLLGMEGDDTEEFDDHVIAHEWGHYFEDKFSRSDSVGGSHSSNDRLDARVAFGEGWATALSGITLNNPNYCDSLWSSGSLRGFRIDIENWNTGATAGWYNEFSILKIVYDLWDGNTEAADNGSIGFGPIYDVMTGPQSTTAAFTSIFTFAEALKNQGTGQNAFIDSQLTRESITAAGIEPYGSTETNSAGGAVDVLPVYTTIPTDGSSVAICSNSQFDRSGGNLEATGNKLSEHRFLRMNVATAGQHAFTILTDAATVAQLPPDDLGNPSDQSDPDIYIYRNGILIDEGASGVSNQEVFTRPWRWAITSWTSTSFATRTRTLRRAFRRAPALQSRLPDRNAGTG
jgi:hypothetical protein